MRAGVVVCPIWCDLSIDGEFLILIHYVRLDDGGIHMSAAFTRYNGELTNVTERMRNLKLTPDWRARIPNG